tara:strand:+ start:511 stop:924 length:414 start_codon:yes stop_codon:yes gene_type:complete
MSKHIDKNFLYNLPSGAAVHPCRLIHKDGTLMWKHALLCTSNAANMPSCESQEQHIIKTAQRLEELNSWVSRDLEPWNGLQVISWYTPQVEELSEGIGVYFKHAQYKTNDIFDTLSSHIQSHETLDATDRYLYFKRC